MSLKKAIVAASFVIFASAAAPATASADWLFTPFLGATFGGSANVGFGGAFKDEFERNLNYGASLAGIGSGGLGFEIDFGYSPNFFGVSNDSANINLIGDGNVTTLMGNLIIAAPRGGIRPYASGGIGIIGAKVDNTEQFLKASTNDLGLDAGGGIMCLSGNIGVRGDLRYFRSLRNNDPNGVDLALGDFRFWRGTVGVTFKF
jgi:opacity protein-like surface antigen